MSRAKRILAWIVIGIATLYVALVVIAYLPQETVPSNRLAGIDDEFITVNNHAVHYTRKGSGRLIILVHGFAGSTYTWRKLVPLLADCCSVYAIDLLGFGLSDKPRNYDYDLKSQGRLVLEFMAALGIRSAALVGHSMGGVVAAYAALEKPEMVDSLILISPGFYSRGAPAFFDYMFFPLKRIMARQFYSKNARSRSLNRSFHDKSLLSDELINAYMVPTQTPGAIEALERMMTTVATQSYEGVAGNISQPTLIIWGEMDETNLPADGRRLKREIKKSSLVYVPSAGHYVQEEKPEQLADSMRAFLTVSDEQGASTPADMPSRRE